MLNANSSFLCIICASIMAAFFVNEYCPMLHADSSFHCNICASIMAALFAKHNAKKMIQNMMKNEVQVGEEVVLCYCQVGIMGSLGRSRLC